MFNARTTLLAIVLSTSGLAQPRVNPIFVTPEWLSAHLSDPHMVVLHVAFNRPEHRLGHIPGARFLWCDWLSISTPDASIEMPSLAQAETVLAGLGVTDRSIIVLCYPAASITPAARVLPTLSYFGFGHRTSILDGGLEAWES